MTNISQPEWKSIEYIPIYLGIFREIYVSNKELYDSLLKARNDPHVLDDYTIQRVIKTYSEQKEAYWVWESQIRRWNQLTLNLSQKEIIEELQEDLVEIKKLNSQILALASELEPHTIDRILGKNDEELALDFVSNFGSSPDCLDESLETIKETLQRMSDLEIQYQNTKKTLADIFARFTPNIPPGVPELCGNKLGMKVTQLQNVALRSMLADYCLFNYPNSDKPLIAEYMDSFISELTSEEVLALYDFQKARFAVLEVKAVLVQNAIAVYDLIRNKLMIIFDEGLSEGISPGLLIVCHIVHSSGVSFTTDVSIVIGSDTQCGQLINQEISSIKENRQTFDEESHATRILQVTYQNI
jgi:hypothetical protein